MPLHRFFCPDIPDVGSMLELPPDESRHAARVLRVQPNDRVGLMDGRGTVAAATIAEADKTRRHAPVMCRIVEKTAFAPARLSISLFVAVPRGKLMGRVVRDATELGVGRIVPILCEFGVAKPDATPVSHWTSEAVAAIKQSGNVFLPRIEAPCSFATAVARTPERSYVGSVPGSALALTPKSAAAEIRDGEIGLWIGPEGGFSDQELRVLSNSGCEPLTVGPWILTLVTAVPALIGALLGRTDHDLLRCERC